MVLRPKTIQYPNLLQLLFQKLFAQTPQPLAHFIILSLARWSSNLARRHDLQHDIRI